MKMKEIRGDGETTTISSSRPTPPVHHASEKHIIVDHERSQVHLVSSTIPSTTVPVLNGLQILNSTGLFANDPRSVLSAHLIASIQLAANNPGGRFQIPIPIPLTVQMPTSPLYSTGNVQVSSHLPASTISIPQHLLLNHHLQNNNNVHAQQQQQHYDIFSSWMKEQAEKEELILNSTNVNGIGLSGTPPTITTTTTNTSTTTNKSNNKIPRKYNKKNNKEISLELNNKKKHENPTTSATSAKNKRNKLTNGGSGPPPTIMIPTNVDFNLHRRLPFENKMDVTDMNVINSTTTIIQDKPEKQSIGKKRKNVTPSSDRKKQLVDNLSKTNTKNTTEKLQVNVMNNGNGNLQPQSNVVNINNNNINSPNPRDKVFNCPICNRTFGYKHVLQNHERTHTGEKPFECNICSKKFTRDHHLKTHMRLHTGEKPYQCSHCDRQFVQVANLRRHLRVHTGERPYACDVCDSKFSDSNQLKAHNLIHKGEKPYNCIQCNGRFRRRHHLIHHKCNNNSVVKINDHHIPLSSILKTDSSSFLLPTISPPLSSSTATTAATASVHSSGSSAGSHRSEHDGENKSMKRARKSRATRRIIRLDGLPIATKSTPEAAAAAKAKMVALKKVISVSQQPEQTQPEDLSLANSSGDDKKLLGKKGSSLLPRNYSGSHSSYSGISLSPSPPTSGSRPEEIFAYCHSVVSSLEEETPEFTSTSSSSNSSSSGSTC